MKKRIGTIYNKPIIEGDINLKTPNEIHKSELKGGGDNPSGGSVSKYAPRYFKIDWNKASKDWKGIITYYDSNNYSYYDRNIVASVKTGFEPNIFIILPYILFEKSGLAHYEIIAFSYIPNCIASIQYNDLDKIKVCSFEETIDILSDKLNLSMEGITEITEEEYYKID